MMNDFNAIFEGTTKSELHNYNESADVLSFLDEINIFYEKVSSNLKKIFSAENKDPHEDNIRQDTGFLSSLPLLSQKNLKILAVLMEERLVTMIEKCPSIDFSSASFFCPFSLKIRKVPGNTCTPEDIKISPHM